MILGGLLLVLPLELGLLLGDCRSQIHPEEIIEINLNYQEYSSTPCHGQEGKKVWKRRRGWKKNESDVTQEHHSQKEQKSKLGFFVL